MPLYVTGAGAALLVTSAVVGLHAKSRCTDAGCSDSPLHEADLATGIAIAGAITAGIGIYLYTRHSDHVVVAPNGNGGTLSYIGSF